MAVVKKMVSIMIPCYNEQESLRALYSELTKTLSPIDNYSFELLFINDGSHDKTLQIIEELYRNDNRISYIDLSRNFGKENAMLAGFDYAQGDCLVIMDADLQHPPSLIPELLYWWEQGYDDVYAKRAERGKESLMRKYLSLAFYSILERSTRFEILKNVGDFRLLDRKCVEAMKLLRENERYTKGMFCWIGFKKKEVIFEQGDRLAGESSWGYRSLFNLAIEGIVSFTTFPLKIATMIGFFIALGAFLSLLYFLFKTLLYGDPVQGFPTLVCIMLFLGGMQLISIGIVGEYLGRVFHETKNRPTYLIRQYEQCSIQKSFIPNDKNMRTSDENSENRENIIPMV